MTGWAARPRYDDLGSRLRALREARGLAMSRLARSAGISVSFVGHIEHGRARPGPALLRRLADTLGAAYDELAPLAGYPTGRPGTTEGDGHDRR